MAGVKGRSGPQARPETLIKRAIKEAGTHLPELMRSVVNKGIGWADCPHCGKRVVSVVGDKDCAFYAIDKVMGRTPIAIDQRVSGVVRITADERRMAIMEAHETMQRVLELPVVTSCGIVEREGSQYATQDCNKAKESEISQ